MVHERAKTFLGTHACTPGQRALLTTVLGEVQDELRQGCLLAPLHLPVLTCAGVGGDDERALDLAVRTLLLDLSVHVLDDLTDGDHPPSWQDRSPGEMLLATATLLAVVPLSLRELAVAPHQQAEMSQTLTDGFLQVSAGQHDELRLRHDVAPSAATIESIACLKAGERQATYAALGAQLAAASPDQVEAYARLGRAMGTAAQLASDCYDLFVLPFSHDLANGTLTFPIAVGLEHLPKEERDEMLTLLHHARHDHTVHEQIRRRLHAVGVARRSAIVVELYCQQARRALEEAQPQEPARSVLEAMVDQLSFHRAE